MTGVAVTADNQPGITSHTQDTLPLARAEKQPKVACMSTLRQHVFLSHDCMYGVDVEARGLCSRVCMCLSSVFPHMAKLYKLFHIVIEVHMPPCTIQTQLCDPAFKKAMHKHWLNTGSLLTRLLRTRHCKRTRNICAVYGHQQ